MNNDDICPALQAKEAQLADALAGEKRIRKGPDSDRPPRTPDDMQKEASELKILFDQFEDIWI